MTMIVDIKDVILLGLLVLAGATLGVLILVDRIAYVVKKRQIKKIEEAYKDD